MKKVLKLQYNSSDDTIHLVAFLFGNKCFKSDLSTKKKKNQFKLMFNKLILRIDNVEMQLTEDNFIEKAIK